MSLEIKELTEVFARKQAELDRVQNELTREKEKNRTALQGIEVFYKLHPEAEFLYYIFKEFLIHVHDGGGSDYDSVKYLSAEQLLDTFECVYEEARRSCQLLHESTPSTSTPNTPISPGIASNTMNTTTIPFRSPNGTNTIGSGNAFSYSSTAVSVLGHIDTTALFLKSPRSQQSISNAFNYLIKLNPSISAMRRKKHRIDYEASSVKDEGKNNKGAQLEMVDQFRVVCEVAYGNFSRSYLVAHKKAGSTIERPLFLKQIRKNYILLSQDFSFADEFDFYMDCASLERWPLGIARMCYAFTDPRNVNLLLKYYSGGDLLHYYLSEKYFTTLDNFIDITPQSGSPSEVGDQQTILPAEYIPQNLMAKIVGCVESMHNLGYVHRSLKMEDFLFTKSGSLRLCDFGSAVKLINGRVPHEKRNVQNLHEYSSPEIVANIHTATTSARSGYGTSSESAYSGGNTNNKGGQSTKEAVGSVYYGTDCDMWSLGCILYELLCGDSPFRADNKKIQFAKIKRIEWEFDPDIEISPIAQDLISKLLCDQSTRVATTRELKEHVFFKGIDWATISKCTLYIPEMVSAELNGGAGDKSSADAMFDTSNFEEVSDDLSELIAYNSSDASAYKSGDVDSDEFGSSLPFVAIAFNAFSLEQ